MPIQIARKLWQSAAEWLLAITMILGLWLARGLVFAPAALPLAIPYAVPLAAVAAPGEDSPTPAPAPVPVVIPTIDGSRVVEVTGLFVAFAGLLARLYLKDREMKRRHADDLVTAYREIAELKRDATELASMVATLRAACPNRESCPVRMLDNFAVSRPSIVPPDPLARSISEIDADA